MIIIIKIILQNSKIFIIMQSNEIEKRVKDLKIVPSDENNNTTVF